MSQVDLTALRMRPDAAAPVPRRPLGPRLVTGCAVLGALVLALSFAWPLFRPVREVAMVQPRQAATAASGSASRVLAEAAGWIEPEPFAVEVVPLVSGRVEEVLVLEGAEVKRGETVLARLASAELSAAFERAEVEVALRERELEVARQAQATAQLVRDQNADLRMRAIEFDRHAGEFLCEHQRQLFGQQLALHGSHLGDPGHEHRLGPVERSARLRQGHRVGAACLCEDLLALEGCCGRGTLGRGGPEFAPCLGESLLDHRHGAAGLDGTHAQICVLVADQLRRRLRLARD
ncbi:MAG: hypothetical protein RIT25_1066, partial [Planctomycetota bacterium]